MKSLIILWSRRLLLLALGMYLAQSSAWAILPDSVKDMCREYNMSFCAGEEKKQPQEEQQQKKQRTFTESESQILTRLLEQQRKLKSREQDLQRREGQLKSLEEDIQAQIAQLEKLQAAVQQDIERKKVQDRQRLDKTVAFYEKMEANKAARSIERLNTRIAVQILMKLKDKTASAILADMNPEKAAHLIEEIARKK